MVATKRLYSAALALVLAAAILFSGCARGAGQAPAPANLAAGIIVPATPEQAEEIVAYLQSAVDDFSVIEGLIEDQNLGLMEEDAATDEELTMEEVEYYLGLLGTYDTNIQDALSKIKMRPTPSHPDIASFRAAELSQFELAGDLISEYMQQLNYCQALLDMATELKKLENISADSPESLYKSISEGIGKTIEELQKSDVPTFLKSMNDNMIESLKEMDGAVRYSLTAEELDDPVRRDAADYRMGILIRKLDKITADADTDMNDRKVKLKEDLTSIQLVNRGLKKWVQDNIDKLSAQ